MSPGSRAMSHVAPLRAARRELQRRWTPPAAPDGPGSSSMASPGCAHGAAVGRQPVRAPGRGAWAGLARPVVNTTAWAGQPHNDLKASSREVFVEPVTNPTLKAFRDSYRAARGRTCGASGHVRGLHCRTRVAPPPRERPRCGAGWRGADPPALPPRRRVARCTPASSPAATLGPQRPARVRVVVSSKT